MVLYFHVFTVAGRATEDNDILDTAMSRQFV